MAILIWAVLALILLAWYGRCSWRYGRARAARRVGEPSGRVSDLQSFFLAFTEGSSAMRNRQADPKLESSRGAALRSFGLFLLVGLLGLGPAVVLSKSMPPVHFPQVNWSLPGGTGGSAGLLALVVVTYLLYMSVVLIRAWRGGPEWLSGRAGDLVRLPRRIVVAVCLAGMIVASVMLFVTWMQAG